MMHALVSSSGTVTLSLEKKPNARQRNRLALDVPGLVRTPSGTFAANVEQNSSQRYTPGRDPHFDWPTLRPPYETVLPCFHM